VAELIRHVIDTHTDPIPAVLEIPSKECPYDASKDSILRRAKVSYNLNTRGTITHTFKFFNGRITPSDCMLNVLQELSPNLLEIFCYSTDSILCSIQLFKASVLKGYSDILNGELINNS